MQHRKRQITLKQRMGLCLAAFFAAFAMQLTLNGYQSRAVQAVQDAQMGCFNAISRFQGGVESSISVLENYRWENSEPEEIIDRLQSASSTCNAWLWRIGTSLNSLESVSDEQRVLYSAVDTVYQTYTGLLDELEKGKWPSFVKDMKEAAQKNPMAKDLLHQLELSYKDKIGHWKHGGIVGVKGYGSGVIGRYSDRPDLFPNVQAFHTMRVNHPTGWFYKTDTLRKLCDIWDKHGSGLTNMHGSTGDAILLGTTTEHLQPCFNDLSDAGFDLGGSGSALRTPSACVGPARCEWACIDSLDICYHVTMTYQDKMPHM